MSAPGQIYIWPDKFGQGQIDWFGRQEQRHNGTIVPGVEAFFLADRTLELSGESCLAVHIPRGRA
jgi:hypothetical protein